MSIELSIPVGLTTSQIIRANPSIDEETAKKLAADLHDIVSHVQKAYAQSPSDIPIEGSDAVQTILRVAVGLWPADKGAVANESVWIMERISHAEQLTGVKDLYHRYLLICDKVCDTGCASAVRSSNPTRTVERTNIEGSCDARATAVFTRRQEQPAPYWR